MEEWMNRLVAALIEFEGQHPKLFVQVGDGYEKSDCLEPVLDLIPLDKRPYYQGWADGRSALLAEQGRDTRDVLS